WWNEAVKKVVDEKKRAYEEWLQCNTLEKYEIYKQKRMEVKRKVKEAKKAADVRWGESFGRDWVQNRKKAWKEVSRIRKGDSKNEEVVKDINGRLVRGSGAQERWAEYFEGLLNEEDDREANVVAVVGVEVPVFGEENNREITPGEVERALKETNAGKAAGMDGVRAEMLKKGGTTVIKWLVRLFNICFMLSLVPADWVCACIVPLFKGKGDRFVCSNYRGISLLSAVGKVYGRILINRIRDKTFKTIMEVQGGFLKGRGCTDQVFVVRQVCEKYLSKGKDVYFAFMDLEKAYDRVDRNALWDVLVMYGVGGRLLRAVKSLYNDSRACVRVGTGVSDWFPVRMGLRQGCVMSPWLFNLYIDGVVREVNARVFGRGLKLVDAEDRVWELSQLLFADDTVLVADSEEKLQRLVAEFGRVCERRKLRVNVAKSKVMKCTRNEGGARMNVILNGEILEEVNQFKYLGSIIAAGGGVETDVSHRISEGCKVLGGMKSLMKNRGLGMNIKKVLYERVIVPTVTYGSELWGMKVSDRQKLNVFEMRCLRDMMGVTRMDRVRNDVIRQRTGVETQLATRVDRNVLRWFGHVERMDNDTLLKRVLNAKVDGRWARGRPRLGWMDGVKNALQEKGMDVVEAKERARNRNEWRAVVGR
ncbi:reverse transcriptase domain-containing protein, partial [Klebsiella pneumoniae]|uniref:RNA-directed DNA polymerase n=1 Tax=Klebsiella pneumoniae TaxID=573 RepID=UPI003EBE0AB6